MYIYIHIHMHIYRYIYMIYIQQYVCGYTMSATYHSKSPVMRFIVRLPHECSYRDFTVLLQPAAHVKHLVVEIHFVEATTHILAQPPQLARISGPKSSLRWGNPLKLPCGNQTWLAGKSSQMMVVLAKSWNYGGISCHV